MSVTVTDLSPFERKLTIRFEGTPLDRAETRAARRLSRQLDINGFRRGRAPRRMVENLVGKERIRSDAIEELLESHLPATLVDEGLAPAVTPSVDAIRDLERGVEVDVRVSLWPALDDPPDYRDRRFELADAAPVVDEDTIGSHLDQYRDQFAELETVERTAMTGDYVAIDLRCSYDGRSLEAVSVSDFLYEVGSDVLLEDLGTHLVGTSTGDIVEFRTRLRFEAGGLAAGTEIDARVLVKEVKEKRLPDLDDEWASDFTEFDTVEELRNDIADRLENSRLSVLRSGFQAKVVSDLTDEVDVEIPRAVIDASAARMFERMHARLQESGMSFDDYLEATQEDREALVDRLQEQAAARIRTQVMLDSIAVDAGLEVDEGDLRAAYEQAGSELGETADELAERLAGSVQEMNLMSDILRTKALTVLMRRAVATDRDGNVLDLRFEDPDGTGIVEAKTEQGDQ